MAEKIIKHRLFTWFEKVDSLVQPGVEVLAERIAHMGEKVDITNPDYIKRGEELGSFYSDDEAKAIEAGTYRGQDAEVLMRHRTGASLPQPLVEPLDDEGPQTDGLSAEELAEYITSNKLNVDKTVALAGDTLESIELVLDAEGIATDNEPRVGVTRALEAKLTGLTQS